MSLPDPKYITDPEYYQVFKYVKLDNKDSKVLGLPKNCYSLFIGPADLHDPKADIIAKYQEFGTAKYLWHNLDFYTCDLYAKANPSIANKYIKPLIPQAVGRARPFTGLPGLHRMVGSSQGNFGRLITIYHK
ncbi:hypothetical protein N9045_00430 [bacterium]|nr:hypothetical protein [bacterium]